MPRTEPGWTTRARMESASWAVVVLAVAVGLSLIAHAAVENSATYDEVTYMEVGAHWWRTGEQASIARMGSPMTFWKLQQAPTLWWLDRTGRSTWIDDPLKNQAQLLPVLRRGGFWIWAVALLATAAWAGRVYGSSARAFTAWLFAIGPNLLAHGSLITMELPVTACAALAGAAFWHWLYSGSRRWWLAAAVAAGVGLSCKFTILAFVPLFALAQVWVDIANGRRTPLRAWLSAIFMGAAFLGIMAITDLLITGAVSIPLSETKGTHPALEARLGARTSQWLGKWMERPWPQDFVAFVRQMNHQATGGPSYLLGERRMRGWPQYYLVAMAVKLPLGLALLLALRCWIAGPSRSRRPADVLLWILPLGLLVLSSIGSTRNYGIRYLLPAAPASIVWISGIARGGKWMRAAGITGLMLVSMESLATHPHQLSFFNRLVLGAGGGRRVLADSNLDWGQGAWALARLQEERPELNDLTLYYFGQTDPGNYGVRGRRIIVDAGTLHPDLPERLGAETEYLAVSASLAWGPWGPEDYFASLSNREPLCWTADGTIAVYRVADLPEIARSLENPRSN